MATTVGVTDEKKLKRFLHYASIGGTYLPGARLHAIHYKEDNIDLLVAILKNMQKEKIFEVIKKVYKENTSPHQEMIPFVLAECARIDSLKIEALKTAEILCDNTKLFLLFFKFGFERVPKIGCGPACKRLIGAYYLKKDVTKLAGEVAQFPKYRGWRHQDLFRLAHLKAKPDDIARQALFAYISRGAETMNKHFNEPEPKPKEIVDYLNKVDSFRKERDPARAAETIETYMLTVDHLNFIHLKNRQVWCALLRQIPLRTLLDHFSLIARNKLFRSGRGWDADFKSCVRDSLQNNQAITDSGLHPSRVFIENIAYQFEAKFKLENAVKKNLRVAQKAPAVSSEIVSALNQLMNATFKLFKPTNLRYIIAVDPFDMTTRKVGHIPFMLPSQGAAITVQSYLKIEPNVTVVAPTWDGPISPIEVAKTSTAKELEEILSSVRSKTTVAPKTMPKRDPTVSMVDVFEWAQKQKKKFDVFILVATAINATQYVAKFAQYQRTMKLPRSKLVLLSLCCAKNTVDTKDIFVVSGFDDKVLPLIVNFVKESI
uniref:TROVE domain-containing protein n=1 Tax=Lygus hesperus TaxID=30085 RepID=A0A0K8S6S4_LYGHE